MSWLMRCMVILLVSNYSYGYIVINPSFFKPRQKSLMGFGPDYESSVEKLTDISGVVTYVTRNRFCKKLTFLTTDYSKLKDGMMIRYKMVAGECKITEWTPVHSD
jgi:hypothetical protein